MTFNPFTPSGGGGGGGITPPAGDIGGSTASPTVVSTHLTSALPVNQGGTGAESAAQNAILAGPATGGAGSPSFRALAVADVPTLNQNSTGTAANITDTLDQVPAPAANVAMANHKLTGLANGSAATDSAAFGQVPTGAASASFHPTNPTQTTSTTPVMMGLGGTWKLTPSSTGKILIAVSGVVVQENALTTISPRYGTGVAPSNGGAASGTVWGLPSANTYQVGGQDTFSFVDIITLTPGTAYWFDLGLATANASDAASIVNLSCIVHELGW